MTVILQYPEDFVDGTHPIGCGPDGVTLRLVKPGVIEKIRVLADVIIASDGKRATVLYCLGSARFPVSQSLASALKQTRQAMDQWIQHGKEHPYPAFVKNRTAVAAIKERFPECAAVPV